MGHYVLLISLVDIHIFRGRYLEESMDEERDDSREDSSRDDKPPMVNGMAVPIREGPGRSARPGKRVQPMDTSDEFEVNGGGPVDSLMQVRS